MIYAALFNDPGNHARRCPRGRARSRTWNGLRARVLGAHPRTILAPICKTHERRLREGVS